MTFVATYSNGAGLRRKPVDAGNRMDAYAKALRAAPRGFRLTALRKKRT